MTIVTRSACGSFEVRRNRFHYFIAGCLTVVLGISARRYAPFLPRVIGEYAPDTLWALMAFLVLAFYFRPGRRPRVGQLRSRCPMLMS